MQHNLAKQNFYLIAIALFSLLLTGFSWAEGKTATLMDSNIYKSGCCSWHDGVCAYYKCCDGSDLSATCRPYYTDADLDGYYAEGNGDNTIDCNDNNQNVYPNASEACNGIDDNCNGQVDEGGITYYRDSDGDGYGNPNDITQACSLPSGYVIDKTDCNDNSAIYNSETSWYKDSDNDGYSDETTKTQCERPSGYKLDSELASINGDCDDAKASVYPGTDEICGDGIDQDCNATDLLCPQIITIKDSYSTGKDATFIVTISYDGAVNNAFLYYRPDGSSSNYTQVRMSLNADGQWIASILASDVPSNGIEYYIFANNSIGNTSETEPKEAYIIVPSLSQLGMIILFLTLNVIGYYPRKLISKL